MLVKNTQGNDPAYHLPTGPAKALIAAGVVQELLPVVKDKPAMRWNAQRGERVDGFELDPVIWHSCDCGAKGFSSGPNAHLIKVVHCRGAESVPQAVADEFVRRRKEWLSKRKQSRPAVDPNATAAQQMTRRFFNAGVLDPTQARLLGLKK